MRVSAILRNGYTDKTLLTEDGQLPIEVPRDRAGTFEPALVPLQPTCEDARA